MVFSPVCALIPDLGPRLPWGGAQVPPRALLPAAAASALWLGVCVSTSAAGRGAQPCPVRQRHLLPSSGLAAVALAQSPWKGPSHIPVWRRAWCFELGHLRGAASSLPACAPWSLWLGGSLSHRSSDREMGSVWPGMFAACRHVASPAAREQMVPSVMFALGSISSRGLGEDRLRAPSRALTAKPGQSA